MGQTKATRQGDWVGPPTISGASRVATVAVTAVASATDLHTGRSVVTNDLPAGNYVSVYNAGASQVYVAFDSTSGGSAVTTTTGVPIPSGSQRDVLLDDMAADGTYPHQYLKAIGDGNATLYLWISTKYGVT